MELRLNMKIALDNRVIQYSGIGNYIKNIYTHLSNFGQDIILYDDRINVSRKSFFQKYIIFAMRFIKDQLFISQWLSKNNINVYHVPKNTGVPLFCSVPVVVTIHDIIPHVFSEHYLSNILERLYYEFAIRVSIHKASLIITISKFSKDELIKYLKVDSKKIIIIHLAYNKAFRIINDNLLLDSIRLKYSLESNYILAIGGSEYRKNVERLIHVYQNNFQEEYSLIVIGGQWRNINLSEKYASEKIRFLTNVPQDDLVAIYNMAEVFVFPSFYEGFGIPVLEGMACGVPVVTSNISSMPEVGGDAAVYFDPFDEQDMAAKIRMVLQEKNLKESIIAKGLERVKLFSWEKCATETLKVYSDVLCR